MTAALVNLQDLNSGVNSGNNFRPLPTSALIVLPRATVGAASVSAAELAASIGFEWSTTPGALTTTRPGIFYGDTTTSGDLWVGNAAGTAAVKWMSNGVLVAPVSPSLILAGNGTVGAPSWSFANSPTSGLYRIGADDIGISVAGALDFEITANTFTAKPGSVIATNTISETTAASGVTIDGLLLKDGAASGLQTVSSSATAITTTRVLTLADSGGIFTVAQSSAYDIDLPSPTTGAGCRYLFQLVSPGAFNVTITVAGSAATYEGNLQIDGATTAATGSTITFATGAAGLGDWVECISTSTSKYFVRASAAGTGGITVA